MEFKDIKELIGILDDSKLAYFEMEDEACYIKIDKSLTRNYNSVDLNNRISDKEIVNQSDVIYKNIKEESCDKDENKLEKDESIKEDDNFEYIKSPIVGSFYKAVSPESEPFVKKGDIISKGDIVCIIEAMKLMNEITAEYDCEIIDVICKDSQMVEYGQELFKIRRVEKC